MENIVVSDAQCFNVVSLFVKTYDCMIK